MQPLPGEAALARLGLAVTQPRPATSEKRFPDGGAWRVEIPSVEGPHALEAVLEEAQELGVTIHRVSQGSGVMMLTDAEITSMLALAGHIEVSLFLGPRGTWDVGAATRSLSGGSGPRARGRDQLGQCLEDCRARGGPRRAQRARRRRGRAVGRAPAARGGRAAGRHALQGQRAHRADQPGRAARLGGPGRGLDQRPERPERGADRGAAGGQRRRARPLRRGARRRRRLRAALRHRRADPGRRAGLHQVRAAQRAGDLPGRPAPARRWPPTPAASACDARGWRWTSSSAAAARRCRCHRSARPRCRSRSASREDHRRHHARARHAVARPHLRAGAHRRGPRPASARRACSATPQALLGYLAEAAAQPRARQRPVRDRVARAAHEVRRLRPRRARS